jgi:hypothetical protein
MSIENKNTTLAKNLTPYVVILGGIVAAFIVIKITKK